MNNKQFILVLCGLMVVGAFAFGIYSHQHKRSEALSRLAQKSDLFWPVTETVLNAQPTWASHDRPDPERIWTLLGNTGLNIQKAKAAVQTSSVQAVIKQDLEDAATLKVTKTPGFFVNGRPLQQFGPDQLSELVNEEVRLAYPK
jgi:protein-disulfide isomerase